MRLICFIAFIITLQACKKGDDTIDTEEPIVEELYFPPSSTEDWETKTFESLKWNESATGELYDFLSQNGTRSFIVLSEGKIVIEKYWGTNIQNNQAFDSEDNWYWASAGKTLTACLVGIAQKKNLLDIDNKTSDYLGNNWSSLPAEKEDLILVRHQLTMTTGLDYTAGKLDCTAPECLQYKSDAGSQWYYHNAPYTLLEKVVSNAADQSYNDFTNQNIASKIGMNGLWIRLGDNNVYWSTARSAARFGLLLMNKGKWGDEEILDDIDYFNAMTTPSQSLNPSYGFCTWLNGQSSIILPSLSNAFNMPLSKNAPSDLFAAIGKNGQYIDVIPSKNLVVIRMGEAPDNSLVPTAFHDEMWEKLNAVID